MQPTPWKLNKNLTPNNNNLTMENNNLTLNNNNLTLKNKKFTLNGRFSSNWPWTQILQPIGHFISIQLSQLSFCSFLSSAWRTFQFNLTWVKSHISTQISTSIIEYSYHLSKLTCLFCLQQCEALCSAPSGSPSDSPGPPGKAKHLGFVFPFSYFIFRQPPGPKVLFSVSFHYYKYSEQVGAQLCWINIFC